jgi:hypothetical protein
MQRRKFMQYSALGSASFFASLNFSPDSQSNLPALASDRPIYDWMFLYWMPYDNNLWIFGEPILKMLQNGVQSDNIAVAVQGKLSGESQLSRHLIFKNRLDTQKLAATDSASETVFAEYLQWAKSQFNVKKWAIVILGHGGKLDQISPDEHPVPGTPSDTKWMNIHQLSQVTEKFNRAVGGKVELFFFQNCNKGTLEAYYTLRHAAKYTLASQMLLGAPNYYYEPLLQFLGNNPEIDGGELAEKIMQFEQQNMYHSYTAVNNSALQKLPEKIQPLVDSVLSANLKGIKFKDISSYLYQGDRYADAVNFWQVVVKNSGADAAKYHQFVDFLKNDTIRAFNREGTLLGWRRKQYYDLSGLGLFFAANQAEFDRYRYLPFFSDLKLINFFDAVL